MRTVVIDGCDPTPRQRQTVEALAGGPFHTGVLLVRPTDHPRTVAAFFRSSLGHVKREYVYGRGDLSGPATVARDSAEAVALAAAERSATMSA